MHRARISMATCLVAACVLLAGIGGTAFAQAPKDPIELTVSFWQIGDAFPQGAQDAVYDQIKKDLNITIKPMIVTWSDYGEKYKIWAATNELPDILSHDGLGMKDTWKWQSQGVIRAFPTDLSAYPNLKKLFNDSRSTVFLKDGKYWALPRFQFSDDKYAYRPVILASKEIYDSLGLAKVPETMNDIASMLKAIQKKYPDKVPLTSHNVGWMFSLMDNYNPYAAGNAWVLEGGRWIPGFFSTRTLDGLKALKSLWDAGLLDRDFAINRNTFNGRDKFISGTAAAIVYTPFPGHWSTTYATDWDKKHPGKSAAESIQVINTPRNPDGSYYMGPGMFWSETYVSAKVNDAKMARICMLYDYLMSDRGTKLRRFGIDGTDYHMDGSKVVITRAKNTSGAFKNLQELYKSEIVWQSLVTWDEDFPFVDPAMDPGTAKIGNDWLAWKARNVKVPANYNLMLQTLSTPLKDKFAYNINSDDDVRLLLTTTDLDTEWKALIQKYEKAGLNEMIDEVNKAGKAAGFIQ